MTRKLFASFVVFLMYTSCVPTVTQLHTNNTETHKLVETVAAIENDVVNFGKPPKLTYDNLGDEHVEFVRKLREIDYLKKFDHLCNVANPVRVENGTLPPRFFTKTASFVFQLMTLHAAVSVFEDGDSIESNDVIRICVRFLELQKFSSHDENWSTMLRYRGFLLNVIQSAQVTKMPSALLDFLQKELNFESQEATWYWDAQIRSILDWKEQDAKEEQLFLIALLMDAKHRSKAEAWHLYERFIEKSNGIRYSEVEPLVISEPLERLYASVDDKEYLKRCHAFWSLKENLEVYRIGLIIRNTIVVDASQGSDPQDLPKRIAAEIQVPYPSAQVRFEADPENKNICWIWVRLGIEESLHEFRLPEVVFQRLPLEFAVQEGPLSDD